MKKPLNKQFRRMQKLAGILNEGKLNEDEDKAPLVITVKVTDKGKGSMGLYTGPSEITMTSDENNSQMESNDYYIGNTEFKLGGEAKVYFAQYRHDIKEILVSYLIPKAPGQFKELVNSKYLNPHEVKNLPSDIRDITYANFEFKNGVKVGEIDHRGYFEIVAIK